MPRAKEKASSGLSIQIDDEQKFYTTGSRISGTVFLNTVEDFAIGSVSIEFYGRVKVYFVISHGEGESQHRGRAPLFSDTKTLYTGYHTHKPGSFSWPFVCEVPTNPDVAAVRQSKHQWQEKEHFLATDDYIPGHAMPPTFDMWKWGFGYRFHVFVEYVIRVDVKEAQGATMVLPPTSRRAIKPVMVKDVFSPYPRVHSLPLSMHFSLPDQLTEKLKLHRTTSPQPILQSQTSRHTVRTSKLTNWCRERGISGVSLSFSNTVRDRAKAMFNSTSLPRYTFDITVSVPEQILLLQEGAIPVIVNAAAIEDHELTTIPPENYPDIRIDNLSLEISAFTYIRFKSVFPSNRKTRYDIKLLDRYPVNHTIDMGRAREIRMSSNEVKDETAEHTDLHEHGFDLSKLPGLAPALVSAKMGRQIEKPLAPTFNTYIIAREYTLSWKLELDVAGEKLKISSDDEIHVNILPPDRKDLEALMQDPDVTKAVVDEKDDGEQSDAESAEVKNRGLWRPRSKQYEEKSQGKNKSKSQEAAEEATTASSSSAHEDPIQYQPGEVLPTYQPNPTSFGYRHEIDERPPRYEPE